MIYSLRGVLTMSTPTYSVVECSGVGYQVLHSIHTYESIQGKSEVYLHTHLIVREDAQILFGFYDVAEKDMFLLLTSVSGVGPNSARLILSHLNAKDLVKVIGAGQSDVLRSVKGIGTKTAERIIVDLKDKIASAAESGGADTTFQVKDNKLFNDALSALEVLGYPRASATKAVRRAMQDESLISVDRIIKQSLKNL
jgi:holliday junction DNA helicase RuvA